MVSACSGCPGKSAFYSGRPVKQKRANMLALRKGLQARGTKSAKRKLKKLRERESRYVTAVNHAVTKALVSHYGAGTLYVLEDLTGVRKATEQVRTKQRYVTVSWCCYEFRKMLEYKSLLTGSRVIAVAPAYTSQDCPICGNRAKENRNRKRHEFQCRKCGYQSNDDRIGDESVPCRSEEHPSVTIRFRWYRKRILLWLAEVC